MIDIFDKHIANHLEALNNINKIYPDILSVSDQILYALNNNGKLFLCGNGGSSSDAMHIAGELVGRYKSNRKSLPALSLNSDVAVLTCIGNDFGYDQIFSRQLEGLASSNDFLLGITTSGNSKNVIEAINYANINNINNAVLSGGDGGVVSKLTQNSIIIPSNHTASIQEMHIMIGHIICSYIENKIFGITDNE